MSKHRSEELRPRRGSTRGRERSIGEGQVEAAAEISAQDAPRTVTSQPSHPPPVNFDSPPPSHGNYKPSSNSRSARASAANLNDATIRNERNTSSPNPRSALPTAASLNDATIRNERNTSFSNPRSAQPAAADLNDATIRNERNTSFSNPRSVQPAAASLNDATSRNERNTSSSNPRSALPAAASLNDATIRNERNTSFSNPRSAQPAAASLNDATIRNERNTSFSNPRSVQPAAASLNDATSRNERNTSFSNPRSVQPAAASLNDATIRSERNASSSNPRSARTSAASLNDTTHNEESRLGQGNSLRDSTVASLLPSLIIEPRASVLSASARAFAQIAFNDFRESARYIGANLSILREGHDAYLREAYNAYRDDRIGFARSCIQRGIIIRECSMMSPSGIQEYLTALVAQERGAIQGIVRQFDILYNRVKENAETQRRSDEAQLASSTARPIQGPHPMANDYEGSSGLSQSPLATRSIFGHTAQQSRGAHSPETRRNHHMASLQIVGSDWQVNASDRLADEYSNLQLIDENEETSPLSSDPRSQSSINRPDGELQRTGSRGSQARPQWRRPWSVLTLNGGQAAFAETEVDTELLDPRYKKRQNGKHFFTPGRVFAVLWHENAGVGGKHKRSGSKEGEADYTSKGKFGEKIFSHIRRFIVVKQKSCYSWCIPINTYGGFGLTGKKFSQADIDAHTIVYESGTKPPKPRKGEPDMTKDPISVDMVSGQKLHAASRLCFGKVQSVDWNVKVMEIGQVSQKSMPFLEGYWNAMANE